MVKRLSLYFEPAVWEKLNLILAALPLSGKPFYELPTMNDLIEGAVVWVAKHSQGMNYTSNELVPFIEGRFEVPKSQYSRGIKGRISFAVTERLESALKTIREVNATTAKEKIDYFFSDVSDAILIRACVYAVLFLAEPTEVFVGSKDFFINCYFSYLYNLRPVSVLFDEEYDLWVKKYWKEIEKGTGELPQLSYHMKEELNVLNAEEKDSLRRISWDEGIIRSLVETKKDSSGPVVSDLAKQLDNEQFFTSSRFTSRGFNFNYALAYIGFNAYEEIFTDGLSIPEVIWEVQNLGTSYISFQNAGEFVRYIWDAKQMSTVFNVLSLTQQELDQTK